MPPSTGRPRDPTVDARILRAAWELLCEGGLDAVTVAEVAQRAGVTRPTVYRRHADAESLARAVLHTNLDRLVVEALDAWDDTPTVLDQLTHLSRPFFTWYTAHPAASRAMLKVSLFAPPEDNEGFRPQAEGFIVQFAQRLMALQQQGRLLPHAQPVLLAQAWFGFYLALAIGGVQGQLTLPEMTAMLRAVLHQHLVGLAPPAELGTT